MTNEQQCKMLEAAAKACGVKTIAGYDMKKGIPVDTGALRWMQYWNPLTSSADCAEMCAKLYINTFFYQSLPKLECSAEDAGNKQTIRVSQGYAPQDKLKAWMYAATMVAAKIGGYEK